jgi:hypothetical protein
MLSNTALDMVDLVVTAVMQKKEEFSHEGNA